MEPVTVSSLRRHLRKPHRKRGRDRPRVIVWLDILGEDVHADISRGALLRQFVGRQGDEILRGVKILGSGDVHVDPRE